MDVNSGNFAVCMLIHSQLANSKSRVSLYALQRAWETTLSPTESYEQRKQTDGMLNKLLKKSAEPAVIMRETSEKNEKGYLFKHWAEGTLHHVYFNWNEDEGYEHEMEYRHPGTSAESDDEDEQHDEYKFRHDLFSPITTVAGQHLLSITFAAPPNDGDLPTRCDLHPSYEMQLTVRCDDYRKCLYYDCFEFKPTWWTPKTGNPPTWRENRSGNEVLGCGNDSCSDESDDEDGDEPVEFTPETYADPKRLKDAMLSAKLKAHAGAFMHSRMFRLKVPLSLLRGLRVHTPEMEDSSDEEEEDEEVDEENQERNQSVLVFELQKPASDFAVRCVASNLNGDNKFAQTGDWSPGQVASRATRHYICGRKEEINNIASHLGSILKTSEEPDEKPGKRKKKEKKSIYEDVRMPEPNSLDSADLAMNSTPAPQMVLTAPTKKDIAPVSVTGLRKSDVHNILAEKCGVTNVQKVSMCLKRAIMKEHIVIDNGLETVVTTGRCLNCSENITCTVEDILYQRDYAGLDYEDGGEDASLTCQSTKCKKHGLYQCREKDCSRDIRHCSGIYVTGMCEGNPSFDSGKFHNHCDECEDFGVCLHDYREAHCQDCGEHFFRGLRGFPCPNCGGGAGKGRKGKPVNEKELPNDSIWDGWVRGYTEADALEEDKKFRDDMVKFLVDPDNFDRDEACGVQ